ncbi:MULTISPECIES: STAS domain-containing protein [Actinosynnema]|uniref:STAS domain-containing protein n=1 Tax=Actinosynnema TaxID=40566 RepID=UPI0027E223C5|nr:STAS domain-containing protein [Actinosynnema pretiosum]MCP2092563.1 anti-anti-sigma factor [Actinosynnema pretiosum]
MWGDQTLSTSTVRVDDSVVVLRVRGGVDVATAPVLRAALEGARADVVVVDLTGVDFFTSWGIEPLVQAHDRLLDRAGALHLVVTRQIRRVLSSVGLHHVLQMHGSAEAALAAVGEADEWG